MIDRLVKPTVGQIWINHQKINDYPVRQLRLHISYVLQNIALFPNLTVDQNVSVQLRALKKSKSERSQISQRLMKKVSLDPQRYASRYPNELSGGEQQRICIIRALAVNPD